VRSGRSTFDKGNCKEAAGRADGYGAASVIGQRRTEPISTGYDERLGRLFLWIRRLVLSEHPIEHFAGLRSAFFGQQTHDRDRARTHVSERVGLNSKSCRRNRIGLPDLQR
jgi:hypothetical protein